MFLHVHGGGGTSITGGGCYAVSECPWMSQFTFQLSLDVTDAPDRAIRINCYTSSSPGPTRQLTRNCERLKAQMANSRKQPAGLTEHDLCVIKAPMPHPMLRTSSRANK